MLKAANASRLQMLQGCKCLRLQTLGGCKCFKACKCLRLQTLRGCKCFAAAALSLEAFAAAKHLQPCICKCFTAANAWSLMLLFRGEMLSLQKEAGHHRPPSSPIPTTQANPKDEIPQHRTHTHSLVMQSPFARRDIPS